MVSAATSDAFQPVEKKGSDYVISVGAAVALFFLLYLPHRRKDPSGRGKRLVVALGIAYMLGFFGRAGFFALNAALDQGSASGYVGIIERVGCGRAARTWWLVGAPSLPTKTNRMSILGAGCGPFEGDTVLVEVRPGLLGRPWVAGFSRH